MVYTFESWLNERIAAKGWSAREVARRVGVSHTTIIKLANGQTRPSVEMCRDLARVFGVSEEEVFRLAGILRAPASDQSDVAGLLARLDAMDPDARSAAVSIVTAILEYWDRRSTEGAQARPARSRAGRARGSGNGTTSLAEQIAQFQAIFRSLSEEEQEEILAQLQHGGTAAGSSGRGN